MRHDNAIGKNMVGFMVGDTHYAVDILRVREIVNPLCVVSVPHCPTYVVGVADHRGQTIPVVDMHRRFGLQPAPDSRRSKWIIADASGVDVGLAVDSVTSVFGVASSDLRAPPTLAITSAARFIAGVASHEGSLVFLVDLDAIATDEDLAAPLVAALPSGGRE
ncbi:MAG: chemotaxis protein CheW [Deltaproteobacteria bacterium]|nr:chemotaxis protein CheW [Deltaproteobacteria bacterium]